jgi:glycosyltransferase involved in cell wall biosynthesis
LGLAPKFNKQHQKKQMNLLILTNNPNRASFRQRIAIYQNFLKSNGINCDMVRIPSASLARRQLFKQAVKYDGVLLHKKGLNFIDAFFLRRYSKKIIYDLDDAVMYKDQIPERYSRLRFRRFARSAELADMIITGNSYLAEQASKFNQNVVILPTGLDTKAYRAQTGIQNDEKIRLVWIGSRSTLKYLAEIKPALEQIGSHFSNVTLRIICDDFFDLKNMEVEKIQWSLKKQAADLATSHIGLAPLPDNRFTRGKCGFKILQYQVAGLPVVASPVGVNSEYARQDVTAFHAVNIHDWTEKISQLIVDPQLRKQMGNKGTEHVQNFDTSIIGKKLLELIKQCLEARL